MRPVPQRSSRCAFTFAVVGFIFLLQTLSFGFAVAPDAGLGMLSCQPEHVRFHQVVVGQNSTLPVIMTNVGSADVTITQVTQSLAEFQIQNLKLPLTIKVGKSVQFNVVFTPDALGHLTDQIGFVHDGSNSPYSIYAHGGGVPSGALTTNPPDIWFGNVQVGNNQTDYATLKNTGNSAVTISRAPVDGAAFSISGLSLPARLEAGQSITFAVIFAPQTEGKTAGHITVGSDAPNPTLRIGLTGNGTRAGQLTVSPSKLDFGNVSVDSSKTLSAELSATGADVVVSSAIVSNSEFQVEGLSLPVTIPAGQKIAYSVKFQPTVQGRITARLTFVSNATNSPTSEILSGNGVGKPDHSVALSWKPSKSPDVVGYNVYRKVLHQGSFLKLNSALDSETAYTDDNVEGGVTYVYVTTAVDSAGSESRHSNKVTAAIPYP